MVFKAISSQAAMHARRDATHASSDARDLITNKAEFKTSVTYFSRRQHKSKLPWLTSLLTLYPVNDSRGNARWTDGVVSRKSSCATVLERLLLHSVQHDADFRQNVCVFSVVFILMLICSFAASRERPSPSRWMGPTRLIPLK